MIAFFQSLWEIIVNLITFVVNGITSILDLLQATPTILMNIIGLEGFLPPIFVSFFLVFVFISTIFGLISWLHGGSS